MDCHHSSVNCNIGQFPSGLEDPDYRKDCNGCAKTSKNTVYDDLRGIKRT